MWKDLRSRDKYEIFLTALVSLAIVAKEEKPFPLALMVELDKFLRKMFKPEQLARKEMELRSCLSEKCNIVVFSLESINLMGTLLRKKIEEAVPDTSHRALANDFYKQIDYMVNDLAKSALIDTELFKYSQQIVAASLFSVSIEIKLHEMLGQLVKRYSDDTTTNIKPA